MNDVSIIKVSHETDADEGEHKDEEFLVVRPPLLVIEERPNQVVDAQNGQERKVR